MNDSFEVYCGPVTEWELSHYAVTASRRTELFPEEIEMDSSDPENSFGKMRLDNTDDEISFGEVTNRYVRNSQKHETSLCSRKTEVFKPMRIENRMVDGELVQEVVNSEDINSIDKDSLENSLSILPSLQNSLANENSLEDEAKFCIKKEHDSSLEIAVQTISSVSQIDLETNVQHSLKLTKFEVQELEDLQNYLPSNFNPTLSKCLDFNVQKVESQEIDQGTLEKTSLDEITVESLRMDSVKEVLSISSVLFSTKSEDSSSAQGNRNLHSVSSLEESFEDLNLVSLPAGMNVTITPDKKRPICRVNPLHKSSVNAAGEPNAINYMPTFEEEDTEPMIEPEIIDYLQSTLVEESPRPAESNITDLIGIPTPVSTPSIRTVLAFEEPELLIEPEIINYLRGTPNDNSDSHRLSIVSQENMIRPSHISTPSLKNRPSFYEADTEHLIDLQNLSYLPSTPNESFDSHRPSNSASSSRTSLNKEEFEIITVNAIDECDLDSVVICEETPENCMIEPTSLFESNFETYQRDVIKDTDTYSDFSINNFQAEKNDVDEGMGMPSKSHNNFEIKEHKIIGKSNCVDRIKATDRSTSPIAKSCIKMEILEVNQITSAVNSTQEEKTDDNVTISFNRSDNTLNSEQTSQRKIQLKTPQMTDRQMQLLRQMWGSPISTSPESTSPELTSPDSTSPLMNALDLSVACLKEETPQPRVLSTLDIATPANTDPRNNPGFLYPTEEDIENRSPLCVKNTFARIPAKKTPVRILTQKMATNPVNTMLNKPTGTPIAKTAIKRSGWKKPDIVKQRFFAPLTITPQSMKKKPASGIPLPSSSGKPISKLAWSHGIDKHQHLKVPIKMSGLSNIESPVARYINEDPAQPLVNIVHSKAGLLTPSKLHVPDNLKAVKVSAEKIPVAKYQAQKMNVKVSEIPQKSCGPRNRLFPSLYTPTVIKHRGPSKVLQGVDHFPTRTISHAKGSESEKFATASVKKQLELSTVEAVLIKRTKTLFKPI